MGRFAKRRFAALLLALLLAAASVLPAAAAVPPAGSVSFTEVTPPEDAAAPPPYHQLLGDAPQAVSDEPLRALIVLEKPSLLEKGYEAADLADNADAQAYNEELEQDQSAVIDAIEEATGEPLEVVWRLTVITNLLSVWVLPEQMETIAAVPGVRSVQEEAVAVPMEDGEPGEAEEGEPSGEKAFDENAGGPGEPEKKDIEPDWETDYTGAGQRIAIIDTGTDEWHRSLNSGAWMHSLEENADLLAPSLDKYLSSLDLLDEAGIADVLDELTIMQRHPELLDGEAARQEAAAALANHGEAVTVDGRSLRKIAFGANYADAVNYADIAHTDEEHGSHVAGIAAANRYVPDESCWDPATGRTTAPDVKYENAVDAVKMQGVAPDAQLLVMQVFGTVSSFESDYMAALQDALVLGADSVNLSLGSSAPGATFYTTTELQRVVNKLIGSGAVVAAAHGNSFYWTYTNTPGTAGGPPELPYADDIVFDTGGDPSTCDTFLAVAAANTSGDETRMADFSSWGVPSTLELKPEITAPGQDIRSLNGAHDDVENSDSGRHDNYELMSGTSMAAPQITGMAALVMEHLKKHHSDWDDAMRRHVAQSLLMSTAEPLAYPGEPEKYYPVLQQGAGLANVKKAVTANAYITMDENAVFRDRTAADGKVKAELGQSESGEFEFSFTVHNLDPDTNQEYEVSTDLFTQAPALLADGRTPALSTETMQLQAEVQYDGDVEKDGDTGPNALLRVAAGGTADVTVKIKITDTDINEKNYPNGAYVEGYTWLFQRNLPKGEGDVHSIPLLGFYGDWSAPSMFDRATTYDNLIRLAAAGKLTDFPCGPSDLYTEASDQIKTPYTGFSDRIGLLDIYLGSELLNARSGATGGRYSLLGNPWFLEPEFPAQQMAINRGDTLVNLQAIFIRNAIADMEFIRVDDTGAQIGGEPLRALDSCYVHAAFMMSFYDLLLWDTEATQLPNFDLGPQDMGLDVGDRFALRLAAMPEYYWLDKIEAWGPDWSDPPENWDMRTLWDKLGAGAKREYPLWVDSGEGPQVNDVLLSKNRLTVKVQDDLYTAWVTVLDTAFAPQPRVGGSAFFPSAGTEGGGCVPNLDPDEKKRPSKPGEEYGAEFTFTDAVPEQFIIMVGDYAGNARYYLVDTTGSEPPVQVTPPPTPTPTPRPVPPQPRPLRPAPFPCSLTRTGLPPRPQPPRPPFRPGRRPTPGMIRRWRRCA